MTDEQAPADGAPVARDSEDDTLGERASDEASSDSTEFGITDADLDQIRTYLQKRAHRRSVDDLRPPSKR